MALAESTAIDTGSAANVLFLAPTLSAVTESGCGSLLAGQDADSDALLSVLTVESPEEMLGIWKTHHDDDPETAAFLLLGGQQGPMGNQLPDKEDLVVHPINNPSNLTDLGVATSNYLSDWYSDDRTISCCFRSITTLLQYDESRTVYRFLHQFTQQISAVDGSAHYHMDPSAHEQSVVNTLLTIFDAVVELDDDDSWNVRSRQVG